MGKRILVGVSGGIAAYKSAELVSRLKKAGCEVKCMMTKHATEFLQPLTLETLSGNRVVSDMFAPHSEEVEHIAWARWADAVVLAPATANMIGKLANGIADDFLTTTVMATKAPVWIAPAMNDAMYENVIVQENIAKLKRCGYRFIEPAEGHLACGTVGKGRMQEPAVIAETLLQSGQQDLLGIRVLVTAGPTREAIDPVRFITNHSTGKMGYAIAQRAAERGADVTLVSGPVALQSPLGVKRIDIESAREMYQVICEQFEHVDIVIKAAAVADYRPKNMAQEKIKKQQGDWQLELERNPDILQELGQRKQKQVLIGFAAETTDLEENALMKLKKKNLDFIVANDLTRADSGFGKSTNQVTIYTKEGGKDILPTLTKQEVAEEILSRAKKYLQKTI